VGPVKGAETPKTIGPAGMGGYWGAEDPEGAVEGADELLVEAAVFLAELLQAAATMAAQTGTKASLRLLRTLPPPCQ
jgi:hypothetical protein